MNWIIIGIDGKGKMKDFRYTKNEDEAFKAAVELSGKNDEVQVFEGKLKLIMRSPKEGEE